MITVETVIGANPWAIANHRGATSPWNCGRKHCCYFCGPDCYEPMPRWHTLCVRCSQLIYTPGHQDPMNWAMVACEKCEATLANDSEAEAAVPAAQTHN